MKKIYLILLTLISLSSVANVETLLDSAEVNYKNKKYEASIKIYEKIAKGKFSSSELYYNLANSYFKNGNFPYAILNYEKALKIDPTSEDIIHNLLLANTYVVDKIEEIPEAFVITIAIDVISIFSSNVWAIISLVSFIILLILVYKYIFSKNYSTKKYSFVLIFPVLLLFILTMYFSNFQKNISHTKFGIITAAYVNIKSSPEEDGTNVFLLHEGVKLRIISKNINGWYRIKIKDGNKGWIETDNIELI